MTTSTHPKPSIEASAIAEKIVTEQDDPSLLAYANQLRHSRNSTVIKAARVLGEVVSRRPEMATCAVSTLVQSLFSVHPRVVRMSAETLPAIARVAPAKVAKHLDQFQSQFYQASEIAQEGIVRTYVALCLASVTYQRKLEHVFHTLLNKATPKQLATWAEVLIPALKGEPHASCKEIVEARLGQLPRDAAQKIAASLGIKLRALMAG